MSRVVGKLVRIVLYPLRVVRRRPVAVLLSACAVAVVAGVGLYGYALRRWDAAEAAIKDDRPTDARAHLDLCLTVWPRNPEVHLRAARAARLERDFPAAEAHLNRCLELQGGATTAVQL